MKCWCEEIRNKQGNENYFCIDCQPKEEPKGELKEKLMLFKAMCLKPNITEKQKYERSKMFFELIQMDNTPDNPFDSFDQTCASPYDDPFFSEIADDYLKLIEARSEEPKLWELTEKKLTLKSSFNKERSLMKTSATNTKSMTQFLSGQLTICLKPNNRLNK